MATFVSGVRFRDPFDGSTGTSLVAGSTIAVQAGDIIPVFVSFQDAPSTTIALADGDGSYTPLGPAVIVADAGSGAGQLYGRLFARIATSSGNKTLTATYGGAVAYRNMDVAVGRPASGKVFVLENTAQAKGNSSTPAAGPISYTGDGFAVFMLATYFGGDFQPGSGWTEAFAEGSFDWNCLYRLLTGSGSITGTTDPQGSSGSWIAQVANFKETASGATTKTDSDTGTLTDAGRVDATVTPNRETGTGADTAVGSYTVTAAQETGAGADASQLSVVQNGSETGSGTEGASIVVVQTGSDTGTFSDNTTQIDIGNGGESGTGTDTGSVSATPGPGESGSGAENGTIVATLTARETGTGTESASVVQTGTSPSDSDSGNGIDRAVVDALLASLDTGSGVESASLVVTLVGAETGAGSDTAWLSSVQWTVAETGTGGDAASVNGPASYTGLALGRPYIIARLGGEYP